MHLLYKTLLIHNRFDIVYFNINNLHVIHFARDGINATLELLGSAWLCVIGNSVILGLRFVKTSFSGLCCVSRTLSLELALLTGNQIVNTTWRWLLLDVELGLSVSRNYLIVKTIVFIRWIDPTPDIKFM
jgi:hypothetical protein